MYAINWRPKARKQVGKIMDRNARHLIEEAVSGLQDWPACNNVKPLVNHPYGYRLRVGRFRILFDVETTIRIIEIQEVKKRDEHTY